MKVRKGWHLITIDAGTMLDHIPGLKITSTTIETAVTLHGCRCTTKNTISHNINFMFA
jgi:hypothetical protein